MRSMEYKEKVGEKQEYFQWVNKKKQEEIAQESRLQEGYDEATTHSSKVFEYVGNFFNKRLLGKNNWKAGRRQETGWPEPC